MVYEQSLRDENSIVAATASVSGYCLDLFSSCDAEIAASRELALSQLASISLNVSQSAPLRSHQPSMSFIASLHSFPRVVEVAKASMLSHAGLAGDCLAGLDAERADRLQTEFMRVSDRMFDECKTRLSWSCFEYMLWLSRELEKVCAT
jgi:hypothetical protein